MPSSEFASTGKDCARQLSPFRLLHDLPPSPLLSLSFYLLSSFSIFSLSLFSLHSISLLFFSIFREGPGQRPKVVYQQTTNFCSDILTLQFTLFTLLKNSQPSQFYCTRTTFFLVRTLIMGYNHKNYIESNYAYLVWLWPFACS